MKGKDEKQKPEGSGEPDFEKLYYQVMQENVLYRDRRVSVEFSAEEIVLLRSIMVDEIYAMADKLMIENELDGPRVNIDYALSVLKERLSVAESVMRKLKFEIK